MTTIRLTAAQAMVRFLSAQHTEIDGRKQRLFQGALLISWASALAGVGAASGAALATRCRPYRAHNEEAMAPPPSLSPYFAAATAMMRLFRYALIGPGATAIFSPALRSRACQLIAWCCWSPATFQELHARSGSSKAGRELRRDGGTRAPMIASAPVSRYFDSHHPSRAERAGAQPGDPGCDLDPSRMRACASPSARMCRPGACDYPVSFFDERVSGQVPPAPRPARDRKRPRSCRGPKSRS
jgi:3D-(3,5/4)-trihydroxycyclohexane-1,2-dione acylhydrolase (decyclizing)